MGPENFKKPTSLEKAESLSNEVKETQANLKPLSEDQEYVDEKAKKWILAKRLEDVTQKMDYLKAQIDNLEIKLEAVKTERKDTIGNIKGAVREVISDPLVTDLLKNPTIKNEIYQDDENLLKDKRSEQKEIEMEIENIRNELDILEEEKGDLYDAVHK